MTLKTLSLIIPIYNEELCIPHLWERLESLQHTLASLRFEIIFINDGSKDNSMSLLRDLAQKNESVQVLHFSRNFGHQRAVTAGLDYSSGDIVVVIDADLQDPPEVIEDMIKKHDEGFDIVYARRRARKGENLFKLATASFFYRFLNAISHIKISLDSGDFRLMSRAVVNELNQLRENDRFIRGMVNWLGFKDTYVWYDRDPRYAGTTNYPLKKMLSFALDGVLSFSNIPLRLASWCGCLVSFFALIYGCYIIYIKYTGNTVPGYASIMVTVLFMGGVQLLSIGILGEYLGRVYIQNKQRPLYIVKQHLKSLIGTKHET